jgi:predicted MFS family arabinose efflux permease
MRSDFHLSYVQIGALMTIPGLVSAVIEPVLGILADTKHRCAMFLAGGAAFAVSVFLSALSPGAGVLVLSWILFSSASPYPSGCWSACREITGERGGEDAALPHGRHPSTLGDRADR